MPTFYSSLAAAQKNTASLGGPAEWQLPGVVDAKVRCFIDSYTAVGTEVAADVIRLFTDGINNVLPAGANILRIEFTMSANIASLTASVGDYNSATRYASASTFPQSGATALVSISGIVSGAPYIIGTNVSTAAVGVVTNGDNQIILTLGGSFTFTAGTILTAILFYTSAS